MTFYFLLKEYIRSCHILFLFTCPWPEFSYVTTPAAMRLGIIFIMRDHMSPENSFLIEERSMHMRGKNWVFERAGHPRILSFPDISFPFLKYFDTFSIILLSFRTESRFGNLYWSLLYWSLPQVL